MADLAICAACGAELEDWEVYEIDGEDYCGLDAPLEWDRGDSTI